MSPQFKRLKNLNLALDAQKAQPDILVGPFLLTVFGGKLTCPENLLA